MALSYPEFVEKCDAKKVGLPDELQRNQPELRGVNCYQPDSWCGAVAVAGNLLREEPDTALIERPIPEGLLKDGTTAQLALRGILNASLHRDRMTDHETAFFCTNADNGDNCGVAEAYFAATIAAMTSPKKETTSQFKAEATGWAIIAGEKNKPIGLLKMIGERSTLSLVPLLINGVPYPAGSLFWADTGSKDSWSGSERLVVPSVALSHVAFLRLSLFGFSDLNERREVFETQFNGSLASLKGKSKETVDWRLERLRRVCAKAIKYGHPVL